MSGTLLLDIGNSRVKWAFQAGDSLMDHGECDLQVARDVPRLCAQWPQRRPQHILAANVAGEDVAERLGEAAQRQWGLRPAFVHAESQACGVTNGYREPEQLGVDRWLAMIGAFGLFQSAVCVVDWGTAITIDGVEGGGAHIGGMIAPGVAMMRHSLLSGTAGVRPESAASFEGGFGRSTAEAVEAGTTCAANALIEQALQTYRERLGDYTVCVITGGNAPKLKAEVMQDCHYIPDLVLRGLACYAS